MAAPNMLYDTLREVLRDCNEFENDKALRVMFSNKALHFLQYDLPEATTINDRVAAVIEYLANRRLPDGRSALPVFLTILIENYNNSDTRYAKLSTLAAELESQIDTQTDTASVPPSSTSARSPHSESSALQEARLAELIEEYEAIHKQWMTELDDGTRVRIERRFANIDRQIQEIEGQLKDTPMLPLSSSANPLGVKLRTLRTEHREELIREYEATSKQLDYQISEVNRLRMNRHLTDLEQRIGRIDALLDDLPSQPSGNAPLGRPGNVLTWLHLADLQIKGRGADIEATLAQLSSDILAQTEKSGVRPDFVVITGDIAFSGQAVEYRYAVEFLKDLLKRLQISQERLFVIPGNHDVDREAGVPSEQDNISGYVRSLRNYASFAKRLGVESRIEPDQPLYNRTVSIQDFQITLWGLNTAIVGDSSQEPTESQREYFVRQVQTIQQSIEPKHINIALLHHPLELLERWGLGPQVTVLQQNSDFILHAHLHQDDAARVQVVTPGTLVIQSGSDYFTEPHPNCYNLVKLDFGAGQGTIIFRRMIDGVWQEDTQNRPDGEYRFSLSERLRSLWLPESESLWVPPLAGYVADTTNDLDRLGIETEVNAFSAVIASKDLEPPLCLGLFGDWGSGKTFFMNKMQKRIEYLAAQSQKAEKLLPPRETTYCTRIVQVNFNAWHYTDADLLACLVEQIFESLGKCYSKEIEDREIEEVERHVAKLKEEKEEAQRSVETAKIEMLQNILTPKYNIPDSVFTYAKSAEDVVSNLGGIAMQIRMVLKGWEFLKIFFVFLAIYVASAILQFAISRVFQGQSSAQDIDKIIDVLLKAFETVGVIYVGFKSLIKPVTDVKSEVQQALAKTVDSQSVKDKEKDLNQAERVFNQEKQNLQALKSPLSQDLIDFIRSRRDSGDYKKHLGVISMIRRDFESLPDKLAGKVDRIVLYIDDLDRCPDTLVAEVLQAVHRILAFPLFVVVIGVDSRWLLRSLEETYPMLKISPHPRAGWSPEEIWAWQSTPQNYLEKIFQIPYNLRPMEESGFRRLVDSILPPPLAAALPVEAVPVGETPSGQVRSSVSTEILPEIPGKTPGSPETVTEPTSVEPARVDEPEIDLTPNILKIEEVERRFIGQLVSLIPTPRAAKRFINIYRLIRATIPQKNLPAFVGDEQNPGEHRAVMVLLATLTGYPRQSPYVFKKLLSLSPSFSWQAALTTFAPRHAPDTELPQYQNQVVPMMDAGEANQWRHLGKALSDITGLPDKIDPYARWIPTVARFSFRVGKIADGDSFAAGIRVIRVESNPPGHDAAGEYARIENQGAIAQRMTGWKLSDKAHHTFQFPDFTLQPGATINVWVGQGTDSTTDLYWGRNAPVWNNDGDIAELRDANGVLIDTYEVAPQSQM